MGEHLRHATLGSTSQQIWAEHSESLWRRANEIARQHPESDVSDVYHALRCLQLTPSQRLAAGLRRGRLRALRIDGVPVKVLSLERIIASKRSTNRPKDIAALPALEATLRARDSEPGT